MKNLSLHGNYDKITNALIIQELKLKMLDPLNKPTPGSTPNLKYFSIHIIKTITIVILWEKYPSKVTIYSLLLYRNSSNPHKYRDYKESFIEAVHIIFYV